MFRIVLRGGPPLPDDSKSRVLDIAEPQCLIERSAGDGTTLRFRITGDYELTDGHTRRVYAFEDVGATAEPRGVG